MSRIRTIKPSFWKYEELSNLPEATHMLAAALLNYADDAGYFNANPGLIRAECCPLREPSVSIPVSLRSLQEIGFITIGKGVDGKTYGRVVKFEEHQVISHKAASKIADISITWECSSNALEHSSKPPEPLRPEGNKEKEGNKEREKEVDSRAEARLEAEGLAKEFEETFWPQCWVKDGKKEALAAFIKARKTTPLEEIMAGVERYKRKLAQPDAPKPKYPQGWLNGERWNDGAGPAPQLALSDADSLATQWRRRVTNWLEGRFWVASWGDPPPSDHCEAWRDCPALRAEFLPRIEANRRALVE